jgi:hypothetical protein
MKLSPFVIGVISAQSGDYDSYDAADGDRGYYGGSDWSGMASNTWNYGSGRAASLTATAVTCWESNNMGTHDKHHQHFLKQDDEYGWKNVHHGHKTAKGTVHVLNGAELPASPNDVHDYHSQLAFDHRLSGCIYEIAGWDFTSATYNKVHTMTYGSNLNGVGYDTTNSNIYPVWWHYFNAHVLAGGNTHTHKLVMANPTYEGLGYLNFIVTFLKSEGTTGSTELARNFNVNQKATNDHHTDLYSNGEAFTLSLENTATDCDSYAEIGSSFAQCYSSKYPQTNNAGDDWTFAQFAISSFPQNDLGKDFRFNLRMMHHLGEGDSFEFYDSYYFYRVDRIIITFPTTVSCPWELQAGSTTAYTTHKCMDSAAINGHQRWFHDINSNVDTVAPQYVETLIDNGIDSDAAYPLQCHDTGAAGHHNCGEIYTVTGLMHMYDEHAQNEYGTVQEIWFQFYYKFAWVDYNSQVGSDVTGVYNYPNKLFNAFEVVSVAGSCSTNTSPNKCNGGVGDASEENWSENP